MHIQSNHFQPPTRNLPFLPTPPSVGSPDQFQASGVRESLPNFFAGGVVGAVGVGVPGALAMGAVKALATGHLAGGLGLAVAAGGLGAFITPLSAAVAVMGTDNGNPSAFYGYVAGAGLSLAGAAAVIF